MSVVISGSTGITLPDNGSLSTSVAGAMVIDSAGRVTKPLQPAFNVNPSVKQNNMALGASVTIIMDVERFDIGSNFASNTFTAPVTGKYQLNLNIRLDSLDTGASYYQVSIRTSNKSYTTINKFTRHSADLDYISFNLSVLADMDAGDTAYGVFFQPNGAQQTDVSGASAFSGYLVA